MASDIAIFGAGGFGRETAFMIRQINDVKPVWNLVGFYDDALPIGSEVAGLKILGGLTKLNAASEKISLVVAVADPLARKRIVHGITNDNIDFPVLTHPHNFLGDDTTNQFGRGCIIAAGNILTINIHLEEFVIINLACTIGHDVTIGSFSTVMPGSNISGNVSIGESTLIGSGACVLQNVTIGNNCKIGAGAVVIKGSREGVTLVGVPATERL